MLANIKLVLDKVTVNSFELFMKLENGLLSIIFDLEKAGMSEYQFFQIVKKHLKIYLLSIP